MMAFTDKEDGVKAKHRLRPWRVHAFLCLMGDLHSGVDVLDVNPALFGVTTGRRVGLLVGHDRSGLQASTRLEPGGSRDQEQWNSGETMSWTGSIDGDERWRGDKTALLNAVAAEPRPIRGRAVSPHSGHQTIHLDEHCSKTWGKHSSPFDHEPTTQARMQFAVSFGRGLDMLDLG